MHSSAFQVPPHGHRDLLSFKRMLLHYLAARQSLGLGSDLVLQSFIFVNLWAGSSSKLAVVFATAQMLDELQLLCADVA